MDYRAGSPACPHNHRIGEAQGAFRLMQICPNRQSPRGVYRDVVSAPESNLTAFADPPDLPFWQGTLSRFVGSEHQFRQPWPPQEEPQAWKANPGLDLRCFERFEPSGVYTFRTNSGTISGTFT